MKFNRITGESGQQRNMQSRRMRFEACLEKVPLGEEDAIRGVLGNCNARQGGYYSMHPWKQSGRHVSGSY